MAVEAGVALSTASRALSGRKGVSPGVRRAVEDASRRMGYRRSAIAASLRTRTTGALGMVIPDIINPFFPAIIQGVEREFARDNLTLVLCDAGDDVEVEAARIETLLRHRVDALIICPVDGLKSASAIRRARRDVRIIQIDRHALDDADFVGVDDSLAMSQVVEHLHAVGARTAVFAGSLPWVSTIEERERGFVTACAKFGVELRPSIPARGLVEAGRDVARQLIADGPLPDAIVCANDPIALGVLSEFRECGVRCPADVLVTGFDDSVPAAELLGLTTVRQPLADMGREAARLFQHKSGAPRTIRLMATLVVRSSTSR